MAGEEKRFIDQVTDTALSAGDYIMVDSSSEGTRKFDLGTKLAAIDTAITAEATARTAADSQLREDLTAEETARESADDAINAELATKADTDGAIANAEQLLSDKYAIDQVPYTFRASGGDGADREYDEIVGGSIVWNQLCNSSSVTVLNGHKYYMVKGGTASIGASTGSAITGLTSGTDMVSDLTQMFGTTIADYIYNLEQTTAGAGVAWFKKFFPKDYYAYDAGTMMHVSGISAHEMVGFNLFDKSTATTFNRYLQAISSTEWAWTSESGSRSIAIRCFPNTQYCVYANGLTPSILRVGAIAEEDLPTDSQSIPLEKVFVNSTTGITLYTTGANAKWLIVQSNSGTFDNVKDNLCINLSWDGERNGEYEPYVKHSYPLDDSLTLRGILKLDSNNQPYYDGDTYAADGTVTRKYGSVILNGSESWVLEGSVSDRDGNPTSRFYIEKIDLAKPSGTTNTRNYVGHMVSAIPTLKGGYVTQFSMTGVEMGVTGYQGDSWQYLYIIVNNTINTTITTVNALKSWLASHPLEVVYELATPTTETATPFTNPQVCNPYGTEEYVTTSLVPVGHYTKYPANLRFAIERVMEQVPEAPSANGTYTLKATRTSSGVTYAWTAE